MYATAVFNGGKMTGTVEDVNKKTMWMSLYDGSFVKRHIQKHSVVFHPETVGRFFTARVKAVWVWRRFVKWARKGKRR